MHDLSYFRTHLDASAERLASRGTPPQLDQFRELDRQRRSVIAQAEHLKARRNAESAEIAKLRKEGVDTTERQQQVRLIGEQISALDEQVRKLDDEFRALLAAIPR